MNLGSLKDFSNFVISYTSRCTSYELYGKPLASNRRHLHMTTSELRDLSESSSELVPAGRGAVSTILHPQITPHRPSEQTAMDASQVAAERNVVPDAR